MKSFITFCSLVHHQSLMKGQRSPQSLDELYLASFSVSFLFSSSLSDAPLRVCLVPGGQEGRLL